MFSLEVSDYQDTDAREKNNDFLIDYLSISAVFSISILMEEIELLLAQKYKFEKRAKSKQIALFGKLECHESDAWIKTKGFLSESSSTN